MNEKMQSTTNMVELQGLLVNNTLEVKTDKNGRKFIGGTLEINTGTLNDECIIPIDCMQYELKKDGSRNALYDRYVQMINWPSAATVGNADAVCISINRGEIADNSFYSEKSGKVIEGWRIRAVFIDQATKVAPRNNSFTVQGVVDSVKEVVNMDGEPTGELRVELLTVGFGERITRVPMFVTNKEGIKYIENNWNPGDLVTAYGEIVYEQKITEVTQETAFGEGNTKKYTDVIKKLVIKSGTSPKSADEHMYDRNKLLSLRAAALKDIEERYLANRGMSTTTNTNSPYLDF
jgi:hypothetical protein